VQREVLAYLRAQPAEHTVSEWTDDYPASREIVDVTCPSPGFVPLDRIAAAVIGEPVTRVDHADQDKHSEDAADHGEDPMTARP